MPGLPVVMNDKLQTVTKEDFPLPTLGPYLESVRDEVVSGRGFALIRGVPVDRWGLAEWSYVSPVV
jgi:hypothetical protein